jgi:hypothetical protein
MSVAHGGKDRKIEKSLFMTKTSHHIKNCLQKCAPGFSLFLNPPRSLVRDGQPSPHRGVSRERARELVLQHINQDPSLVSLRELYDMDLAKPELNIINVTGMTCVGASWAHPNLSTCLCEVHDIVHDVHKLRIVSDPKIHYDLLRFLSTHAPCLPCT